MFSLFSRAASAAGAPASCTTARITASVILLFSILFPFTNSTLAQTGQQQKQDEPIKLKATLVQVPVVVSDQGGRYITDLSKDEFEIFEDGTKQDIDLFASTEIPFSVALLLDCSGSTVDQLNQIKSAALAFIDNLRPVDRVMVISFDDSVHVQCEFTSDRGALRRAVEAVRPGEYTQVYEAVYTAVWEHLRHVDGRRAAIIFTDGIDTASSEISQDDTLDAIADAEGVLVYPIRYSTREDVQDRLERKAMAAARPDAASDAGSGSDSGAQTGASPSSQQPIPVQPANSRTGSPEPATAANQANRYPVAVQPITARPLANQSGAYQPAGSTAGTSGPLASAGSNRLAGAGGGALKKAMTPDEIRESLDRTYREADEYLDEMARLSGGVVERADTLRDLSGAFAKIAEELRKQYLLGYYPSDASGAGSERRIQVRVSRPDVTVRARPAYRAPE